MTRITGIVLLLANLFAPAFAAHPLVTEDPFTQERGNHQIELNMDSVRSSDERGRIGALTYTYGIHSNLDVFLNLPQSITPVSGLMDMGIGVKWLLYEHGPITAAVKSELLLPTGNVERGLGTGRSSAGLVLIGAYQHQTWEFLGNIGLTNYRYRMPEDRDLNQDLVWRASVAALYSVNEQWRIVTDLGLARNTEKLQGTHPAYFLTGVIYSPTEQFDLDAGLKWGLNCKGCAEQIRQQFGVGLSWRF